MIHRLAAACLARADPLTQSPIVDPVEVVAVVFITLAGLAIGSFLNVVIWRVPRGESIVSPPSHCPQCDAEIRGRDNIPVLSWLILRGKCRDCGAHISARYPGVELLTGALFLVMTLTLRPHVGAAGLPVSDRRGRRAGVHRPRHQAPAQRPDPAVLPDRGWAPAHPRRGLQPMGRLRSRHARAGSALFVFYLLLALVYPAGMGMGDVKLSGTLGMALAWLGWGEWLVGSFLAFLLGAFVGLGMMLFRGRRAEVRDPVRPLHARRGAAGHPRGPSDRRLVRGPARRLTVTLRPRGGRWRVVEFSCSRGGTWLTMGATCRQRCAT